MTVFNSAGVRVTETQLNALTSAPTDAPVLRVLTEDIYQSFTYEATGPFEGASRMLFHAGQVVPQSEIDALFLDATIDSITPATGPAAGSTAVTIRGTNFSGAAGVTFDGVAATAVKVVSDTAITCVTPAGTAGTADVIVVDDAGSVTETAGFTYV